MIPHTPNHGAQQAPPLAAPGATAGGGKIKPVDPLRFARKYMWVLLITGVLGVGLGVGLQLLLSQVSPYYTSLAQMKVGSQLNNVWNPLDADAGGGEAIERFVAGEVARLKSDRILRMVLERQAVQQTEWFQSFALIDDALEALDEEVLSISGQRESELINLVAVTPNTGSDAVVILTTLIDVYTDLLQLESDDTTADNRVAYQEDVNRNEDRIRVIQDQIRAFVTNEDIDSLDSRYSQATIAYRGMAQRMADLRIALSQSRAAASTMKQQVESGEFKPKLEDGMMIERHPLVLNHSQRIQSLKEQLGAMEEMGRQNSHAARLIKAQIAAAESEKQIEYNRQLQQLMQQQLEATARDVSSLESTIQDLNQHLAQGEARVVDLNAKMARYEQMQGELENTKAARDRAQAALDNIAMSQNLPSAIRVRRWVPPQPPKQSFPPSLPVMAGMGLFGFLGLVGGLLYLRELLDQRFTSPADVALLPDTDLLAVLPRAQDDPSGEADMRCIVQRQPNGLIAESFRQLRTDLLARVDRRGYRSILIAGASAESGTTTVVQNLALSLAANARRVLIIDANLRRPEAGAALGLPSSPGLSDYLSGRASADGIVHAMSDLPVSVLPCGSTPEKLTAEAFESAPCRELMSRLESEFDLVLIDCPPILLTSEAKILAKHVDAAVVVTMANRDKRGMTARALRRIDGQRADLLGLVLNGVRSSAGGYFRQNFREFYRYGQADARVTADAPLRRPEPETADAT
jgi:capsular exopolysaccharide synthesis family protein